jgi:hypothetical protein
LSCRCIRVIYLWERFVTLLSDRPGLQRRNSILYRVTNDDGSKIQTATESACYGNDERQGEIWIILDIDTSEEHRGGIAFSGKGQGGGCESDLEGKIPENSDHLYYRIRLQPYFLGELADRDKGDWRKVGKIMFVIKGMELLTSLDPEVFLTRDEVYLNFDCETANYNWFQSGCMGMDPELEIYEQLSAKLRERLGDRLLTVVSSIFQVLLENPAVAYPMFGQRCYPDPYYWDNYREDVTHAMAVAGDLSNPGGFQVIYRGRGETCDPFYFWLPGMQFPLDIDEPGAMCEERDHGCYEVDHEPQY